MRSLEWAARWLLLLPLLIIRQCLFIKCVYAYSILLRGRKEKMYEKITHSLFGRIVTNGSFCCTQLT